MKKISFSLLLSCLFLLSACGQAVLPEETTAAVPETMASSEIILPETTTPPPETTLPAIPQENVPFRVIADTDSHGLYYYDATENYDFDRLIAEGGVASSEALVRFGMSVYPNLKLDLAALGYGCTAFCAQGNDGFLYGRNFDMDNKNTGSYLIVHTAPEGGYESFSTVNLRFIGIKGAPEEPADDTSPLLFTPYVPLDGINEKGVVISVLQLNFPEIHEKKANAIAMTSTTIIRYVLDHAANLDEALAIFEKCNLNTEGYAYHYLIGDANGDCAIIEYAAGAICVERFSAVEAPVALSNTFVTEKATAHYIDKNAASSKKRSDAILATLKNEKAASVPLAMQALQAGSQDTTRWSIVYDLAKKSMLVAINRDFETLYSFSLQPGATD